MSPVFALDEYDASDLNPITAEFFEYYAKINDRGWHPRSVGKHRITSSLPHIAYGQLRNLDDIAPKTRGRRSGPFALVLREDLREDLGKEQDPRDCPECAAHRPLRRRREDPIRQARGILRRVSVD